MTQPLDIVILGLSITSSWGNGHATTYRSLIRALAARGHRVLFLERDLPWYAGNRDEPHPAGARTELYESFDDLTSRFEREVSSAHLVIVGSFVPEGSQVGDWVTSVARGTTAFYDIDTPVTLEKLSEGCHDYISPALIRRYALYLSFTGGPLLGHIESTYGAPIARPLYCSVDPGMYQPDSRPITLDLGYLGTYSDDRQPALKNLLLEPALRWPEGRFAVTGAMYPDEIRWPQNVRRETHLSPRDHAAFYGSQRFTLNITREAMKRAGYSPSVRLFEAGSCGVPIISDWWAGLDTFFTIGREVLIAGNPEDVLRFLRDYPNPRRLMLGQAARQRVLAEHTPEQRAIQLESYLEEVHDNFSTHPSRRNGRERAIHGGLAPGLPSQRQGTVAGQQTGATSGEPADPSHLHESAGASH